MESFKKSGIIVAVLMLAVGLLGGIAIGKAMNKDDHTQAVAKGEVISSSKAVALRNTLVTLGVEHMNMTDQAVADALDGSPAAAETAKALYVNGNNLAAAVGSVYGKEAETTFNSVWKLHLDQFVTYAVASKQGNTSAAQAALDKIDAEYTKPLAAYLAKTNPNLPQDTLETSLRDHVTMTASMIDKHVQGDYAAEASELAIANKHVASLMSTLADGILKQYPDKFEE